MAGPLEVSTDDKAKPRMIPLVSSGRTNGHTMNDSITTTPRRYDGDGDQRQ